MHLKTLPILVITILALLVAGCTNASVRASQRMASDSLYNPRQAQHVDSNEAPRPTPETAPIMLAMQPLPQVCPEWCWSAAITMVADYYGRSINVCQPPSVKTGFNCCNLMACAFRGCNVMGTPQEVVAHLNMLNIRATIQLSALPEDLLQAELTNGRPVIVALYGSFSGHAVVISGFTRSAVDDPATYRVFDPYYGIAYPTYAQLLSAYNGGAMGWYITIWRITP